MLIILWVSFGVLEGVSLSSGTPTLSQFVWWLSDAFPAFPFLFGLFIGLLIGFLACHFWWGGKVSFDGQKRAPDGAQKREKNADRADSGSA